MGKQFTVEYDDFTGGHYVGLNDVRQPMNTWRGAGVIATADQGMLMPDGGWTRPAGNMVSASATASSHTQPISFRDYGSTTMPDSRAYVHLVAATATTVRRYTVEADSLLSTTTLPNAVSTSAVVNQLNNQLAYVRSGTGVNTIYLVQPSSTTVTTVTTQTDFKLGVWWWNNFGFGVGMPSSRLYFSLAGDPATTWPANNYIDVGESNSPIITLMPQADALYIGKTDGWWVLTGVPGQTATLRRLNAFGAVRDSITASAEINGAAALPIPGGAIVRGGRGASVLLLNGAQVTPFASFPDQPGTTDFPYVPMLANAGEHGLVLDSTGASSTVPNRLWVWSNATRRWRCKNLPTPTERSKSSIRYYPVDDRDAATTNLYVTAIELSGGSYDINALYAPKEPTEPQSSSGVFDTATVELADYTARDPFRVLEVVVEVDFGRPATQTGLRSLGVQVITNSVTDLDQQFTTDTADLAVPFKSSQRRWEWGNAQATRRGHRQTLRAVVNDGATATYQAAPVIEMTGVKVARVIMRCETVG